MLADDLQISPRLRALIAPDVLDSTCVKIAEAEERERTSLYPLSLYLSAHADHIISEAIRRGSDPSRPEDAEAA